MHSKDKYIKPLPDKVVIRPHEVVQTESGIYMPDEMRKTKRGDVLAVGDRVTEVAAGDVAHYDGVPQRMEDDDNGKVYYLNIDQVMAVEKK